ncbi:MAG: dihydrolipoyl dehydrogenase [Lachnospiraceae bacterium]
MEYRYDLIVIGAGPGGYEAAVKAAGLGMRTAIIEMNEVGGTCLNRGCIPTKAFLHVGEQLNQIRKGEEFGISVSDWNVDWQKIYAYKNETVKKLREGILQLLKVSGVDLINGTAGNVAAGQLEITRPDGTTETITSKQILVATGSVPVRPNIKGVHLEGVCTSEDLLAEEPMDFESIVIIGGGVIGVEFAEIYASLGRRVTILESMGSLLSTMDKDISQNLQIQYKKRGIEVVTNAMVTEIMREESLKVVYESKGKQKEAAADLVLLAVGRSPRSSGLFAAGQEPEQIKGRLEVDNYQQSSIPGIYAAGDVASVIQLAHVATAQGFRAVESMAGMEHYSGLSMIPSCVYTNPEIACVGMTDKDAKEKGLGTKCTKYLMHGNCRTVIAKADRSFIKIVSEEETGVILGAQLMCERATDMIGEFSLAIENKMTVSEMDTVIRAHPTYYEAVKGALEALK